MQSLDEFFDAARPSIEAFSSWAERMTPDAIADHLCYKCSNAEEFDRVRRLFESESDFIYQSIISKRRIAVIKLKRTIPTPLGPISALELSDQKPDGSQTSGFDHIEIYPTHGTMDELAELLSTGGTAFEKIERPHHTTYDAIIVDNFKVRLESEALIEKIKATEMR